MNKIIDKYPILLLTLIGIGLYGLNLVDLKVSIMEARNFIVAREMLTEGHWFLTTMNDVARYEKPPFPAWFTTPFAYVFGINNVWAYRFPTTIFSILGMVYFFKLIKIWLPKDLSFYTALVLGTSFYYVAIRFEAPSDIYTHVNMIMGMYFLLRNHPSIYLKDMVIGGIFFGFSILSKGPVSLYTLWLPFILAYFISFKINFKSLIVKVVGFLVTGLIVGGSWYVYVRFVDPQILLEVAEQETGNWTSYNTRPFYYYWSFFIQSGIWTIPAAISLAYPYFIKRVKHQQLYKFSFLWTILALVLLSVIPEKKPRYLVPVLFPLAFNTVIVLNYLVKNKGVIISRVFHYLHYSIVILGCLAIVVVPFFLDIAWTSIWLVHLIMSFLGLAIAFLTFKFLIQKRFSALIWSNVILILLITTIGQSQQNVFKSNDDFRSVNELSLENQNFETYYYGFPAPEIIWEYGQIVKPLKIQNSLQPPYRILVSLSALDKFKVQYPDISTQSPEVFDSNYFRSGERKRTRLIVYMFEEK